MKNVNPLLALFALFALSAEADIEPLILGSWWYPNELHHDWSFRFEIHNCSSCEVHSSER